MQVLDVGTPEPKADQVLVRVHAASINDWDWGIMRGSTLFDRPLHGLRAPRVRILGCDVAGCVESVGAAVRAFQPGDDVYGDLCASGFGAFAEYAYVNELFEAGKLVPVIDGPYSLADIRQALWRYGTGDHHGKVVVRMT